MPTMKSEFERRALMPFEVRQDDDAARVVGHAAVFNQEANIAGMFREVIRPGAFTRAIQESDVPFLIEHNDLPLARNTSGTLKLSEDAIGLRIETDLDQSDPDVQRIIPKMRRGDLSKMSFAFRATRQEFIEPEDPDDLALRVLHEVELFDVSIVTNPAFEGTDIALRSLNNMRDAKKAEEVEAEKLRMEFERRRLKNKIERINDLKQRESALFGAVRRAQVGRRLA